MEMVELSSAEIVERLWILDIVLVSRKIIEEGWFNSFAKESELRLLKRAYLEAEKMTERYKKIAYRLSRDSLLLKEEMKYLYEDVFCKKELSIDDVYRCVQQMEKDDGFEKVGVIYYDSNGKLKEDFCHLNLMLERFYDEESDEYALLYGDKMTVESIKRYYMKKFYTYSIRDKFLIEYLKKSSGNDHAELIVKEHIMGIISEIDIGVNIISWRKNKNEIEVIVEVNPYSFDEYDCVDIFRKKTENLIKSMVEKYLIVEQVERMGEY